jgi:hypothetical protein
MAKAKRIDLTIKCVEMVLSTQDQQCCQPQCDRPGKWFFPQTIGSAARPFHACGLHVDNVARVVLDYHA